MAAQRASCASASGGSSASLLGGASSAGALAEAQSSAGSITTSPESAAAPIPLFGDGKTSRDYTFIDDIVDGVVASIDEAVMAPGFRIYNLGGSRTTTLLGLVELISAALGKKAIVEWQPEQPGDMKRTLADVTLSGRALGYAPKVPIEEGIARFVAWLRTQPGS